ISHRITERHAEFDQRRIRRERDEQLFGGGEVGIAGGDVGNESLPAVPLQSCEGVSDASQALRLQWALPQKWGMATWIGSVQGAVATWSVISMRDFRTIPDSHRLTRSLPLPVLDF